jgi:cysteine sulfinate desulfinase/cysteine desulfurase-like protein
VNDVGPGQRYRLIGILVLGKIPIDVEKWNVSLMSLSGHKIYGPKGVGALYMRRRPRIRIEPQMNDSGQERGIRSRTVLTPLVVGFGGDGGYKPGTFAPLKPVR